MDRETIVDGVPLRVVELTGEPRDMVFCHPVMVHCAGPNRGTWPRFMRIKQVPHSRRECAVPQPDLYRGEAAVSRASVHVRLVLR